MKIAKLNGGPEIYLALQGEGKSAGRPSVFVRTSLCNLHCFWCDTDYTWNWEGTQFGHQRDTEPGYRKFRKDEQIVEMKADQIARIVSDFGVFRVVLTGGEPLLQQVDLVPLLQLLRRRDGRYSFEVETNATVLPTADVDALVNQYNVSPKTGNSANELAQRETPEVIAFFASTAKAVFKYVVSRRQDLKEITEQVEKYGIEPNRVFLMPEGTASDTLRRRSTWILEECKRHQFHFSDRLHVHLHGQRRGV